MPRNAKPPPAPQSAAVAAFVDQDTSRSVLKLPRSVLKVLRSPVELPRSSDELPRCVFKLPRSDPKVPRSSGKVPRPPIRASLGPARFTRVANATPSPPKSPQTAAEPGFVDQDSSRSVLKLPRRNNRPRRSRHPRKATGNIQPALSQGARTILSPCAKCSRSVLVASLWRGNRRSQREAKHAPVRRLVVRGVVPTSQKRPPPSRGLRPASHRNAGQCPNGGGDARRRRKTERGTFSASSLGRESAAVGFGRHRRPRRPRHSRRIRWKRVIGAKRK